MTGSIRLSICVCWQDARLSHVILYFKKEKKARRRKLIDEQVALKVCFPQQLCRCSGLKSWQIILRSPKKHWKPCFYFQHPVFVKRFFPQSKDFVQKSMAQPAFIFVYAWCIILFRHIYPPHLEGPSVNYCLTGPWHKKGWGLLRTLLPINYCLLQHYKALPHFYLRYSFKLRPIPMACIPNMSC